METTSGDQQRQTLCCHFASQEHPPAKSELLWQPSASCAAQVMICIHVSTARSGVKAAGPQVGLSALAPQDFKDTDVMVFEVFQADSKRSTWKSPKAWKVPAPLFAVLLTFRLFGSTGFFFHWKCNFSYNSCYQATHINANSLSQWNRQFIQVAWSPNSIIMRTVLNG